MLLHEKLLQNFTHNSLSITYEKYWIKYAPLLVMSYTPSEEKLARGKSHSLQALILTNPVWKLDAKGPVYALPPGMKFFDRN